MRGTLFIYGRFMLIYIHGFNSSPASHKSQLLHDRLKGMGRAAEFSCPALPYAPAAAADMLRKEIGTQPPRGVTLVGSSLGGYYATYLAEELGLRAVLVNPAIKPYEGLRTYLGKQKNLYTHEAYELTAAHLDELLALDVERPTRLERYYLMVTTGDEVLDYRDAVAKYAGAKQLVVQGSDHGFKEFGDHLEGVLKFAGIK
ncbi:MAG: YqiA/YcfP family alpha/beta fold hydrolase [Betaproteobacteria bacterium]